MKSDDCFLAGKRWQTRRCVEKQRHYSADKGLHSQGYGLPSGHVWLWELDCKEGRTPKNWCLWTMVLEKTPGIPLDNKEIKPVNLKGDQPWIFTGITDAEAPVFWTSDVSGQLTGKVPDAGKDWGQNEKRASEDEMAGLHQGFNEHELGQILGDGEGKGGLACWSPWGSQSWLWPNVWTTVGERETRKGLGHCCLHQLTIISFTIKQLRIICLKG